MCRAKVLVHLCLETGECRPRGQRALRPNRGDRLRLMSLVYQRCSQRPSLGLSIRSCWEPVYPLTAVFCNPEHVGGRLRFCICGVSVLCASCTSNVRPAQGRQSGCLVRRLGWSQVARASERTRAGGKGNGRDARGSLAPSRSVRSLFPPLDAVNHFSSQPQHSVSRPSFYIHALARSSRTAPHPPDAIAQNRGRARRA
jgi:hypothetical protein